MCQGLPVVNCKARTFNPPFTGEPGAEPSCLAEGRREKEPPRPTAEAALPSGALLCGLLCCCFWGGAAAF